MFTLTVLADGRLLLTTEQQLSETHVARLREGFDHWHEHPDSVLVLTDCRVQFAPTTDATA